MLVVGLTGGIASGKSTFSSLLQSHQVPLIDLDILARIVVSPGSRALASIRSHFGPTVLNPDGTLDRARLGTLIFNNEAERKKLDSIVHPAIRRLLAWELLKAWLRGEKMVVVDSPLLIEAGMWRYCGTIIVVYCSEALQLQRLRTRNNLSLADAQARIKSQAPLSSKLAYADYVVDNSGPISDLSTQVERIVVKLKERTGWSWILSWLIPPIGIVSAMLTVGYRLWIKGVGKEKPKGRARGEKLAGQKKDEHELRQAGRRNSNTFTSR